MPTPTYTDHCKAHSYTHTIMRRKVQVNMPVTSWLMRLSTDNNSTNFPEQTRLAVIRSVPSALCASSTGWFAFEQNGFGMYCGAHMLNDANRFSVACA